MADDQGKQHPIHALTTYELNDEIRQTKNAIAYFQGRDPVPPACADLQARLATLEAEQTDRQRIAERSRVSAHG
jgi:hypothetical protein